MRKLSNDPVAVARRNKYALDPKYRKRLQKKAKKWKRDNPAKVRQTYLRWRYNNPEAYKQHLSNDASRKKAGTGPGYRVLWLNNIKHRAKKKNIRFNLTLDDLPMPKRCPIFGTKLQYGKGKFHDNSPSIDRINPAKGYVKGNVQVVSYKANRIKGPYTLAELKKIVAFLEKYS
jgi:hypothetical protein